MSRQFEAAFDAAPIATILVNLQGRIAHCNAQTARLFGISRDELTDRPFEILLCESDQERYREIRASILEERWSQSSGTGAALWCVRADGVRFPVDLQIVLLPTDVGTTLITVTEISHQHQLEMELRECEEQFRSTFHLASVGMVQLDAQTGRFLRANARYCELTGFSLNELRELTPAELTHPDDRARDKLLLQRLFHREDKHYFNEKRYLRKDGRVIWVQISGSLICDAQHRPVRTIAVVHEITERKIVEIDLRESEERLQQAIRVADLGIFDFDPRTSIVHLSPEMLRIGGWSDKSPMTLPDCLKRVHPEDLPKIEAAIRSGLDPQGEGTYDVEHRIVLDDGSIRWIRVKARTYFEGEGELRQPIRSIGAAMEITDQRIWQDSIQDANALLELKIQQRTRELDDQRQAALQMAKAAEQARLQAEESAQALERVNAELEQFAYVASHDLQEPLRKIQAFGNLVVSHYAPQLDAQGQDYILRMGRAAERMQALIDDLLTLSRIMRKGQPFKPVDLNVVVRNEVLVDLESRISQSGGIVDVGPLPSLDADPTQMRQLFLNLIGNALKYTRPGSIPHVQLLAEQVAADHVNLSQIISDRYWRIEIRDQGIGFDQHHAERIFQPFQRLHGRGEYEGTGMGLAICRRIVDRHDGTIEARGELGAGATFIVTLPATHLTGERGDGSSG